MVRRLGFRPSTDASSSVPEYSHRAVSTTALFAFVVAAILCAMSLMSPVLALRRESMTLVTSAGEKQITVEITESNEEKAKGLMFRAKLADDQGMLFFYDTPQDITMWMRNTYIPLDMVFIRGDGVIHRIEARTEPLSETIIAAQGQVSACLELAGGAAERLGLKAGDTVRHKLFKNAK
jgi:uncharacterized membrane protein (UPF0127 family)